MKAPKNIAASIRQRLLNRAKNDSRPFHELLQYYGMERFLYRLSLSPYSQQFILKGALMLRIWNSLESRPTMDIDMLGKTCNEEDSIVTQINTILSMDVIEDGLIFNPDTIQAERITEDADYQGIRGCTTRITIAITGLSTHSGTSHLKTSLSIRYRFLKHLHLLEKCRCIASKPGYQWIKFNI